MAAKNSKQAPQPMGKGPFAALAACSVVCIVLAFMLGTMVGDRGSSASADTSTSPSPTDLLQDQQNASPLNQQQSDAQGRPPVRISPPRIDLGSIQRNETVPAEAEILNTGDEPLTILSTKANCGCTTVDLAGEVIEPGKSLPLNASFKQNNPGARSSTITVLFEGYNQPATVQVNANVQQ